MEHRFPAYKINLRHTALLKTEYDFNAVVKRDSRELLLFGKPSITKPAPIVAIGFTMPVNSRRSLDCLIGMIFDLGHVRLILSEYIKKAKPDI